MLYMSTNTHTDVYAQREKHRQGEEKGSADQAPHQQQAQMVRMKAVLSPQVYIHRQPVLPGVL